MDSTGTNSGSNSSSNQDGYRDALKQRVIREIDARANQLIEASHEIHANPEVAFQEHKAHALLTGEVEKAGLNVTRHACGLDTAFISEFGSGDAQVAIISEYDALPNIGHACGHNIIATAGLGASLALEALGKDLPGRVRYLGTPAEEAGNGKELMAQKGAFEQLDAAMMVHPAGLNLVTMPSLAVSEVLVTYTGKSAHAAGMPHEGVNALDALVTAYQSVAQLRQHIRPNERIHGIFHETGSAPNIVPDKASGTFFVRGAHAEMLAALKKRVEACFHAGALATGCEVKIEWAMADYLEIKNNWSIAKRYQQNAEALGREFYDMERGKAVFSGSTDMGNVSHRVPSIHPMIACAPPNIIIHNPEFARWARSETGDLAVLDGAKSLAMTAIDVLSDDDLRKESRARFDETAKASEVALQQAYNTDGNAELGGCGCC
ncbi:M20 family metallopeptidase [Alphaproteobacteria bacterium]|nr:M20 family metallopeptidase [Alphaproteobacteria bacterium]